MGEPFLSAIFWLVFEKLSSFEVTEIVRQLKINAELKKLGNSLVKIHPVLGDAEERQAREGSVRIWLDELTQLAYDVDDLLDELSTESLRGKLESAEVQTSKSKQVRRFLPSFRLITILSKLKGDLKIKKINERLKEIAGEVHALGLRERSSEGSVDVRQRMVTSSLVDESCVFGREQDVEKIVELLLSDETVDSDVSVIPIVGMGGIGKTTLAQLVYNNDRVKKHFDIKAWVCVSDEFDVIRVTRSILESISYRSIEFKELYQLQLLLEKALSGKKFLIVLDDVWNENYNAWDVLRFPFRAGAPGSKIVITTRSHAVSSIMGTVPPHLLSQLSEDNCWALFKQHAFANGEADASPNLVAMGKEIVKKSKGLPLTAKAIGGLLRSKIDENEWNNVLHSKVWDAYSDMIVILPSLRLSYDHLPSSLKLCFAYCAIFPMDYEFEKEKLVLLWMAEGFVQERGSKRMEDVGDEYFRELVSRSFFQQSSNDESKFVMHDLINDLARYVSRDLCFTLEDDDTYKIPKKARHLSYKHTKSDVVTKFEIDCLRTFLPLFQEQEQNNLDFAANIPKQVLNDLFSKLTRLRVLCLSWYAIDELPDSINNLKHLRYLDLSYTCIRRLPEGTSTLLNLQTLLLTNCMYLMELPKYIGNLVNLRHLEIGKCNSLQKMPLQISRLTCLQTLSDFIVHENSKWGIRLLRDMLNLRKQLCISKLENVVDFEDATQANLKNKQYVHALKLRWSGTGSNIVDVSRNEREEIILHCLRPHKNVKELTIEFYGGRSFPRWIGDMSYSNLVTLKLFSCRKCENLPPLGQLPSLENLVIHGMDGVKCVGEEFYGDGSVIRFQSLKILWFEQMLMWEEWTGDREFPCLQKLIIKDCPKLRRFSPRFPAMVELEIYGCEELSTLKMPSSLGKLADELDEEVETVSSFISLEEKQREEVEADSSLGWDKQVGEVEAVSSLGNEKLGEKVVAVSSLGNLEDKQGEEVRNIEDKQGEEVTAISLPGKLEEDPREEVKDFPKPKEAIWLPNRTESFKIRDRHDFDKLRGSLDKLAFLVELRIEGCPEFVSMPEEMEFPSMIKRLVIKECENLKFLPMGMILHTTTSLEYLEIQWCSSFMCFPRTGSKLPTSTTSTATNIKLKELVIWDCFNLKSLPEGLHNFTSLHRLEICRCPRLLSFPEGGLPTSLRSLLIIKCDKLKCLPDWMYDLTSIEDVHISGCPGVRPFT